MDYRVILSRPALRDLGNIARTIAQDRPDTAIRVGGELVALAESLAVMPRRGSALPGRPGVRCLIKAPYLITYRIDEPQRVVYEQRFWHGRRASKSWRSD